MRIFSGAGGVSLPAPHWKVGCASKSRDFTLALWWVRSRAFSSGCAGRHLMTIRRKIHPLCKQGLCPAHPRKPRTVEHSPHQKTAGLNFRPSLPLGVETAHNKQSRRFDSIVNDVAVSQVNLHRMCHIYKVTYYSMNRQKPIAKTGDFTTHITPFALEGSTRVECRLLPTFCRMGDDTVFVR
jgi:hypothetical protein